MLDYTYRENPLGSIYENDLTHSNAANAAGPRSLQAHRDRTVDFTQTS
jgi:hypothetical protein